MNDNFDIDLTKFPMFTVQAPDVPGGFVCIPGFDEGGEGGLAMAVFTTKDKALAYCSEANVPSNLFEIRSVTVLRDFLSKTSHDVEEVVFDFLDGQPEASGSIEAVIGMLPAPLFQWEPPAFAIQESPGVFSKVEGTDGKGRLARSLLLFTEDLLAEQYRKAEKVPGKLKRLETREDVVRFVRSQMVEAVAFDVPNAKPGSSPKWCVSKERFIEIETGKG